MGSLQIFGTARVKFDDSVTAEELRELAKDPRVKVLQCSTPVRNEVWGALNECFFATRPDVLLRVYSQSVCDLGFASDMTNVRRFSADCLMRANNVEAIAEIPHLESLTLDIFELQDFRVLELLPATLTEMSLGATRSKKPDLKSLGRFRSLKRLYIEGQNKDIEVLSQLQDLEDVTLRSVTTPDLSYLSGHGKLWSLDIKLGGIRSFKGIEGKDSIKYLELWQIRELRDVSIIGELPGLQYLFLQSLPHIESLPSLVNARALRRIVLQNLKSLHEFSSLETAPALEEFALVQGDKQTPEQLLPVLRNPRVSRVTAGLGSHRKNAAFKQFVAEHGKEYWKPVERFVFS